MRGVSRTRAAPTQEHSNCIAAGSARPRHHRSQCEPCIEKRRSAERAAQGLPKCGKQPPASGRPLCEACNEKRNRASRTRDARLRAAGMPRRGRERARAYERERSRPKTTNSCARPQDVACHHSGQGCGDEEPRCAAVPSSVLQQREDQSSREQDPHRGLCDRVPRARCERRDRGSDGNPVGHSAQ